MCKRGGGEIHRQGDNTREREQANVASLTCFPEQPLAACPLQLQIPLHKNGEPTGGGAPLTDGESPRIRSNREHGRSPRTSQHSDCRRRLGTLTRDRAKGREANLVRGDKGLHVKTDRAGFKYRKGSWRK